MRNIFMVLIILLALAAVGCNGEGPRGEVRPTPIGVPLAAEGGGSSDEGGGVGQGIGLRLWIPQDESFNAAYRAPADAYSAAHPGVTITIETFDPTLYDQTAQTALAAGAAADLVQLSGGVVCANSAYLAAVPEVVATADSAQATFVPEAVGAFLCDGVLYGLPLEATTPLGLTVSNTGQYQDVAWDFARFVALDSANAAQWNANTGTQGAMGN